MTREQVLARLREHERELKAAGIVRLSLFGSTVRGGRHADSDIDLLDAFDENRRISLLDLAGIELQLADLLGQAVDLIEEGNAQAAGAEKRRGRSSACLLRIQFSVSRHSRKHLPDWIVHSGDGSNVRLLVGESAFDHSAAT